MEREAPSMPAASVPPDAPAAPAAPAPTAFAEPPRPVAPVSPPEAVTPVAPLPVADVTAQSPRSDPHPPVFSHESAPPSSSESVDPVMPPTAQAPIVPLGQRVASPFTQLSSLPPEAEAAPPARVETRAEIPAGPPAPALAPAPSEPHSVPPPAAGPAPSPEEVPSPGAMPSEEAPGPQAELLLDVAHTDLPSTVSPADPSEPPVILEKTAPTILVSGDAPISPFTKLARAIHPKPEDSGGATVPEAVSKWPRTASQNMRILVSMMVDLTFRRNSAVPSRPSFVYRDAVGRE